MNLSVKVFVGLSVDWILLVLILFFVFWAFQMIFVFRRQLARYDEQAASLNESTAGVRAEADSYSRDNEEKRKMLEAARDTIKAAKTRKGHSRAVWKVFGKMRHRGRLATASTYRQLNKDWGNCG